MEAAAGRSAVGRAHVRYSLHLSKRLSPGDFPRHPQMPGPDNKKTVTPGPDNKKTVTKHLQYSIRRLPAFISLQSHPFKISSIVKADIAAFYKISVCLFGECALVNTILGIQHLVYYNPPPPLCFAINSEQDMVFLPG